MTDEALHLYGIVRAGARLPRDIAVVEPATGGLRLVEQGRVAVACSGLAESSVRPTAANAKAHHGVVEALFEHGIVLPMRFGVVAEGEKALRDGFLATTADRLAGTLDRFDGLVEMRVTLHYEEDAVLQEVVRSNARIRRLRSQIARRPAAATYYDRIALGQEVAAALERVRRRDAAWASARLEEIARGARPLSDDADTTVLRSAYLVERKRVGGFEKRAVDMAEAQAGRLRLELVGPIAPWDFVEPAYEQNPAEKRLTGATWAS